MSKRSPQIVGNVGLYYVCYKLSMLDWNVMPTSRNTRGIDVLCFSLSGERTCSIQVKTLSRKSAVPLGSRVDNLMADYWVIVNNASTDAPAAFVMLPHEVREHAVKNEKNGKVSYWLNPREYMDETFRERWDRIGSGAP